MIVAAPLRITHATAAAWIDAGPLVFTRALLVGIGAAVVRTGEL